MKTTINLAAYTAANLLMLALTIGSLGWLGMQAAYKEAEFRIQIEKQRKEAAKLSEEELLESVVTYKYAPALMADVRGQ